MTLEHIKVGDKLALPDRTRKFWRSDPAVDKKINTVTRPAITLYLAGPMSGLPEYNYPAFHAMTAQLRAAGYTVINPAENGLPDDAPWADHMRADIINLCRGATGVALLPGWRDSQGARLERHIASQLGLPCLPAPMWIDLAHAMRAGG